MTEKKLTDEELTHVNGGDGAEGEDRPNIIIDIGTGYAKSGLSGEEGPRPVFPALVGRPKQASAMVGADNKEFYVGTQADE